MQLRTALRTDLRTARGPCGRLCRRICGRPGGPADGSADGPKGPADRSADRSADHFADGPGTMRTALRTSQGRPASNQQLAVAQMCWQITEHVWFVQTHLSMSGLFRHIDIDHHQRRNFQFQWLHASRRDHVVERVIASGSACPRMASRGRDHRPRKVKGQATEHGGRDHCPREVHRRGQRSM